ncbi:uncharacterized protein [Watersipora subatra]
MLNRKELKTECFKVMAESSADVLRPQRKSFVSGCQMKNVAVSESGDKNAGSGRSNVSNQKRSNENLDRPRSVPTGERKIGSGRIALERSDSRGSSEKGTSGREKSIRHPNGADKLNNWRQRKSEEESRIVNSHGEVKEDGRSREQRSTAFSYHKRYNDPNPEWFDEEVAQTDTIELMGFEGHQEKIEKREKREKERKKKREAKNAEKQKDGVTKVEQVQMVKPIAFDDSESAAITEAGKTEDIFDFDAFMMKEMGGSSDHLRQPIVNAVSSADTSSSRFSQWFNKQPPCSNTSIDDLGLSDSSTSFLPASLDDELAPAHLGAIVKDLLSATELDDDLPVDAVERVESPETNSGGNLIMQLLQQSTKCSSNQVTSSASPPKHEEKPTNALPHVLSKLLASPSTSKPSLPTEYKTLEELEADIKPTKISVTPEQPDLYNAVQHRNQAKADEAGHDMSAFNKLVGILKDTGQLNEPVPKMPEVTNKETPNQLKKLFEEKLTTMKDVDDNSPLIQTAFPRQSVAPHSVLTAPRMVAFHQMRSNSPVAVAAASMNNSVYSSTAVLHSAFGNGGPVDMPMAAIPTTMAAMRPPAVYQAPVNPILQQTMHHGHGQKLSSPIMFGAQPPVHIVAPAPIHPIAGPTQVPLMSQQQSVYTHNITSVNQQFEQMSAGASVKPLQTAATAAMAFTPTSVIRKRVNDKVEERQKQGEAGPFNQPYPTGLNKQASPQPLRPIVKNSSQTSVAEQMRRLVEEQRQAQIGQAVAPPQFSQPITLQHLAQSGPVFPPISTGVIGFQQAMPCNQLFQHSSSSQNRPLIELSTDSSLQSMQQLAFLQQQQSQQMAGMSSERAGADHITKWFCGAELASQQQVPLPKHANMLKLEDVEH